MRNKIHFVLDNLNLVYFKVIHLKLYKYKKVLRLYLVNLKFDLINGLIGNGYINYISN